MKCILFLALIAVGLYAEVTCFVAPVNYRVTLTVGKEEVDKNDSKTMTVHIKLHPLISKIFNNTIVPIKKKVKEGYKNFAEFISNLKEGVIHSLDIIKFQNKNETNPLNESVVSNSNLKKGVIHSLDIIKFQNKNETNPLNESVVFNRYYRICN